MSSWLIKKIRLAYLIYFDHLSQMYLNISKFILDMHICVYVHVESAPVWTRTALHVAAFSGDEQIVQWLLSEGR